MQAMMIDWRSRRNDQLRHSALCQQIIQPLSFQIGAENLLFHSGNKRVGE